jgi:hypothetical protein
VPNKAYTEMNTLRVICNGYNPDDIYNIDETGLFWRYAPNSRISLLDDSTSGIKKDKIRISLVLTSNATGFYRITV